MGNKQLKQLIAKDMYVANKNMEIINKKMQITMNELNTSIIIKEKNEAVQAMESLQMERDVAIQDKDMALLEKEQMLESLNNTITEKDNALSSLSAAIEEKNTAIAENEMCMDEKKELEMMKSYTWQDAIGLPRYKFPQDIQEQSIPYMLECEKNHYITKIFGVTTSGILGVTNVGIMTSDEPNKIKWFLDPALNPAHSDYWIKDASEFGSEGFNNITFKSASDDDSGSGNILSFLSGGTDHSKVVFPKNNDISLKLIGIRAYVMNKIVNGVTFGQFFNMQFKLNGSTYRIPEYHAPYLSYTKYNEEMPIDENTTAEEITTEEKIPHYIANPIYWKKHENIIYFGKSSKIVFFATVSNIVIPENFTIFKQYDNSIV